MPRDRSFVEGLCGPSLEAIFLRVRIDLSPSCHREVILLSSPSLRVPFWLTVFGHAAAQRYWALVSSGGLLLHAAFRATVARGNRLLEKVGPLADNCPTGAHKRPSQPAFFQISAAPKPAEGE
jgi:hypothetical protein